MHNITLTLLLSQYNIHMYVSCDVAGLRKWCAPAKRKMEHEMHTVEQIAKAVDLVIQET